MKFLADFLKFLVAIIPNVIDLVKTTEERKEEKKRKKEREEEEKRKKEEASWTPL